MFSSSKFRSISQLALILLFATGLSSFAHAAAAPPAPPPPPRETAQTPPPAPDMQLGPGDTVSMKVFGQPDMDGNLYVADDGTIHPPLVGSIPIAGLSPDQASRKIENALRDGSFLVNPHVNLTLVQSVNQLVAVLGEVGKPGRYQVGANTTIFQLLAQ